MNPSSNINITESYVVQRSILVVEDDEVFRTRLAKAFHNRGFRCHAADSVNAALAITTKQKHDYALIDLKLPDGSGLDVLKTIMNLNPECKAVLLTGFGTITTAVKAVKLGAVNYLTKPTSIEAILQNLGIESDSSKETPTPVSTSLQIPTLDQMEWTHINNVLELYKGNITKAAAALGVHRRSLQRKLMKDVKIQ